jgi:hypothetical protein
MFFLATFRRSGIYRKKFYRYHGFLYKSYAPLYTNIEPPSFIKKVKVGDHSWRQINHIWSEEDLKNQRLSAKRKHKPKTISDKIAYYFMKSLYHSFNILTGYREKNPSPKSLEWRLIILESFAGVPGFLAAGFRHFASLRNLKRDHGSIFTFLEEAENERMHLLVCLKMFRANLPTRILVILAQITMTPILMIAYIVHPKLLHRFVAYLEETAVYTYSNILDHMEQEGTLLHAEWKNLPAPEIAKNYWKLDPKRATWEDCLRHMLADEAHHRNVNHTFADLPKNAPNPFIEEHFQNFDAAVRHKRAIDGSFEDCSSALFDIHQSDIPARNKAQKIK